MGKETLITRENVLWLLVSVGLFLVAIAGGVESYWKGASLQRSFLAFAAGSAMALTPGIIVVYRISRRVKRIKNCA